MPNNNEVISFNANNYACSIQIHPASDQLLNPICVHAISCAVHVDPQDGTWTLYYSKYAFSSAAI